MSEPRNERALTTMAELARASQRDSSALGPRCPTSASGLGVLACGAWSLVFLAACSGGGGGASGALGPATTQPELIAVEFGRLVDVYGLRATPSGALTELYARDVVIGGNIADQRPASSNLTDAEITYDFIGADPDSLQQRLLIPRDVSSAEFAAAFDALDDEAREVTPMLFGQSGPATPFSVVPRNAGIRLRFSAPLGVDDSFFVQRDPQGAVTGIVNTEAVQLLEVVGDPSQPNAFEPMPVRVIAKDREIVLDPVLLGTEGQQYGTANNAAGLPASPDQLGANIRIALALTGPLALPSLRTAASDLTGLNNTGVSSIVRDFRSGNAADSSSDLARGFVRDSLPLRIVGEIGMYLESVENVNDFTQEITVFKNGVSHEIDRGDVFRFVSGGLVKGPADVVVDPADDLDNPTAQHVRVRVRRVEGLDTIDPRNLPGYPLDLAQRELWLVANAPRAVCVAEFTAGDGRDDPRNFLVFSPSPLPLNGVQPSLNQYVSPFAGAIVRFTKPVDMETVRWADTFFFAMRDLTSEASIADFISNRPNSAGGNGMEPASFNEAKYRRPYLITARVSDETGSQTSLRLQPSTGFYLDESMRNAEAANPGNFNLAYFLHLIAQSTDGGIRDLAGNPLDLQGTTADKSNSVVIPFTVDSRRTPSGPLFSDNLAISIVCRFASRDEDARPSYFLPNEVLAPGAPSKAASYPLEDLFGGYVYVDGKLQARPTTRSRVVVDNLNQSAIVQQPPAPPASFVQAPLGVCPHWVFDGFLEGQVGSNSASNVFNTGIQNPLNPYGCRLQTVWREVDLSLSRTEPFDFNLDIEQMYWAPFTGTNLTFDEFDSTSLTLGHSEYRPIPCVGDFSSLPSLPGSGLRALFERNFAWNPLPTGSGATAESIAPRRLVFSSESATQGTGVPMTIDPSQVVYEPNGINRFLPLPTFQKPYFVFRDERVIEQGGRSSDSLGADINAEAYPPYILTPFSMGQGSRWVDRTPTGDVTFVSSYWNDARSEQLPSSPTANPPLSGPADNFTGGLVGNIALPLLADFWTICDRPDLPVGGGYVASGLNGWQVSVTVQSDPNPAFRAFSGGRAPLTSGGQAVCRSPSDASWNQAQGGFVGQTSTPTPATDNTLYWIMMDVVKRQSVITSGFFDLFNPHRVPAGFGDPRLGPFFLTGGVPSLPANVLPSFAYEFDPPPSKFPAGTAVVPQFRAAGAVDPNPWYWNAFMKSSTGAFPDGAGITATMRTQLKVTADNFPLDPFKAGDAHLRKWDTRTAPSGVARNWWTYLYNRTVTQYVEDPNDLMDPTFTIQYASPSEPFTPRDIRYLNWRFITVNNAEASPPVAPSIETFALSYRFQQVQ
jgi:hypothetical protein